MTNDFIKTFELSDSIYCVDARDLEVPNAADMDADHKTFALIEHLAHDRAYVDDKVYTTEDADDFVSITPVSEIIKGVEYRVVPVAAQSKALIGEIYIPRDPKQSQTIFVNWRGTDKAPSMWADLERAPGAISFKAEEQALVQQIDTLVKEFNQKSGQKIDLFFTGHSLGGALAQNHFNSIQKAIVNPKSISHSANLHGGTLNSLQLGVFNSAGVLREVEESSNKIARRVAQEGIKQKAFYGMVAGDAVQQTGQGSILTDVDSKDAQVTLCAYNYGHKTKGILDRLRRGITGTIAAHTKHHYLGRTPESMKFEGNHRILKNSNPAEKQMIQAELKNKSSIFDDPISTMWENFRAKLSPAKTTILQMALPAKKKTWRSWF